MKQTDIESLVQNISEDLEKASSKDIDKIYTALKSALKTFDRDSQFKDIIDVLKNIFKSKKEKCILIIRDLLDSKEKLIDTEIESLRKELLEISNIHRTLLEDIRALLNAL
jgi:DNA phosphorothioation-dependent restriction protein DptG